MNYKISTIASILGLKVPPLIGEATISRLLTDSRALITPDKVLFFAIPTDGNDGHRFIGDLYSRGVKHFVVDHIPEPFASNPDLYPGINFMKVPSVIEALQTLSKRHRLRFDIPVIGITGSAGKTTVKEWIYQALHHDYVIARSPRSFNSRLGVPLSVWRMSPQCTLGIFEAGISRHGEMDALADIIRPTIGVFTCLNDEHDEGFDSRRQKCIDKARLFRDSAYVVYNADDRLISGVINDTCPKPVKVGWSMTDPKAAIYISSVTRDHGSTILNYHGMMGEGEISIPFDSDNDVQNAIHCLAALLCLKQPVDYISARMSGLSNIGTRLNVIEGVNNCMLMYDYFTPDLTSLWLALDFLGRRLTSTHSLTVILSDLQCERGEEEKTYISCVKLLRSRGVTRILGIGPDISSRAQLFGPGSRFFKNINQFIEEMSPGDFNNEFILIKGPYRARFDKLSELFEARHQETVLEVNLDAIVNNYNHYRSLLPRTTGLVGMVKAKAYGAGSLEVAKTLQSQGAAYLAVALLDEGVALRNAGVSMPVMVLNPRVLNYRTLFTYRLEPEIYSFDILEEVIAEGKKWGVTGYPIHIKFDTGMHRLGFTEADLPKLTSVLAAQDIVTVATAFSHLACADCPGQKDMDDYTQMQLDTFDRCCDSLIDSLDYYVKRHILNTAGIARFGMEREDDLARLGVGLYGIDPLPADGDQPSPLRPVSELSTIITALHSWPEGTTIGYSRKGLLKRPSVIATLPLGYADGLNRHLGNGNMSFLVNGHRCPTVGNICMDACMIDVTDVACSVGDTVEIFGTNIPVTEIAEKLETIPYEVLTSVSDRVKRIYFRE